MIHGLTKHPLFKVWGSIIGRCDNPNDPAYKYYGGRGITMCDEWKKSFKSFYDWAIGNGWKKGLQVDRRNNDKEYSSGNCRVVTPKVNARNRSSNVLITHNGKTMSIVEWSEKTGISHMVIRERVKNNWHTSRLFTPVRKYTPLQEQR